MINGSVSSLVGCLNAVPGNTVCALSAPCGVVGDDRDACVVQIDFARECRFGHARRAEQRTIELRALLVKERNKYSAAVKKTGAKLE